MPASVLQPMLALIVWTLLVWILLYARRIPAMTRAEIKPEEAKFPGAITDRLDLKSRAAADNYNHLLEQPTIFYALCAYLYMTAETSMVAVGLAWAYVVLRVLHSAVQVSVGRVMARFVLFALSTLCLFGMVGVALI